MSTETPRDPIELSDLLLRFWRWKWHLLIALVVGCGVTYGITKLVRPEYESFAILYPVASSSRDKLIDEFNFGFDVHAERLVQMIESTTIQDSVVKKFRLAERYEVDQDKLGWEDDVTREYFEKIRANKTKFKSVAIVVRDYSPDTAAKIANYISGLVNVVNANILKSSAESQLASFRKQYEEKEAEIGEKQEVVRKMRSEAATGAVNVLSGKISSRQSRIMALEDSISGLRNRYQVYDLSTQIQNVNVELVSAKANLFQEKGKLEVYEGSSTVRDSLLERTRALVKGAEKRVKYFEGQLSELTTALRKYQFWNTRLELEKSGQGYALNEYERISGSYSPDIENLDVTRVESELSWDLVQLNEIREKYEKVLSNYLEPLPASYVISEARPSYKKVFPKTLLSLAIAALFSVFFTYIVLMFREKLKQ